jgi:hypothetical protein
VNPDNDFTFDYDAFCWRNANIIKQHHENRDIELAHARLEASLMEYLEDSGQLNAAEEYRAIRDQIGFVKLTL